MRRALAIGLMLAAVLSGGCGGEHPPPPANGELVRLVREGRAPYDTARILVRPDGHAILTSRVGSEVVALGPDTPALLRQDLDRSHFSELSAQGSRTIPGPDAYRYAISYRGRTLRFEEGSVPTALKRPVATLSDFLDGAPRRPRDILVRVRRSGGLADSRTAVYVQYDGQVLRFGGRQNPSAHNRLTRQALARLTGALERAALAKVPSSSLPPPADGYVYEITFYGRTLRFPEGGVPAILHSVVALVRS